ncbi:MAG: 4-(cytidine 5'-diphospho)-2-C-methyl-D-erythritol kinase [Oscillospiraceae bacterium]|nr:4-(cytidine 5'-diphospho)-2-C-methyl-D-erythritol kinase [Oscillospiraceae bacterium]
MCLDEIREKACAKLNISLDVLGKRPDGYHDMVMIMQTVSLTDEVSIERTDGQGIRASTNLEYIPGDERNLAVRAAGVFFRESGIAEEGLRISIRKKIPVGAGLAGGSADAGAVLRALNRLYGMPLDREGLVRAAEQVGSDVAFCTLGGTMLASGRGEILTRLPSMPECWYGIIMPHFSISTPELFRKLDGKKIRCHPDTQGLVQAVENGDLSGVCRRMYNVFEDVDDRRMRTVAEIKGRLMDCGAMGALMTGTGSAVFAVFESQKTAETAVSEMKGDHRLAAVCGNVGPLA